MDPSQKHNTKFLMCRLGLLDSAVPATTEQQR